ncbi:MAG TPA: MoxR family ATPase [Vicinamibacteria bacterium]|nr:MoxR family ATPase [Vicinamibacteria bacterium]
MIEIEKEINQFHKQYQSVQAEMGRVIVGNHEIVSGILSCLLTKGHVLLEGIPGLGKTKIVQTLANVLNLKFNRIQFTPDLMPGDIIGTNVVRETEDGEKFLDFQPGPIFCNLMLADEVNRATPKSQSALLEAMQEKSVSVGKITHKLEEPFFVMATQNPIELEGTYPLPEAQMDRFLFKLKIVYPTSDEMHEIMNRTTQVEEPQARAVLERGEVLEMRKTVLSVPIARSIQDYAIRLTLATHPNAPQSHPLTNKYVRFGASPRGTQALVLGGKVQALLNDRAHVAAEDIRNVAYPALRHRMLLNFEGEAEHVDTDNILREILKDTPGPRE